MTRQERERADNVEGYVVTRKALYFREKQGSPSCSAVRVLAARSLSEQSIDPWNC